MQQIRPLLLGFNPYISAACRTVTFCFTSSNSPILFSFLSLTFSQLWEKLFCSNKKGILSCPFGINKMPYISRSLERDFPLFSCFLSASSLSSFATFSASFSRMDGFTSFLFLLQLLSFSLAVLTDGRFFQLPFPSHFQSSGSDHPAFLPHTLFLSGMPFVPDSESTF